MSDHEIYMRVHIYRKDNNNKCAITIDFIENISEV